MLTGLDPTREPACAPMWKSHAEALSYVLRNRRSRTHKLNSEVLFGHRDRPDHVRVEPAVILNRAGRLEHDPAFGVGRHHSSQAPFRAVAVWATISSFTHSIVSPTWAETCAG